jgi:hypothetical protein
MELSWPMTGGDRRRRRDVLTADVGPEGSVTEPPVGMRT